MSTKRFTPTDDVLAIEPVALEQAWMMICDEEDPPEVETDGDVSVIEVRGPLESRGGWWFDGYAGEHGIVSRVKQAMLDPATKSVLMVLGSPGGTCSGLLEALDEMRSVKTKPVVAFSEGGAYSAAYTLAMLADRVVVTRASGVGSIGVIATMVSQAEALKNEGVAVAVIASGSQKTDGHPALEISEAAKTRMRARVNELAGLIADECAKTRGMTRDQVLGLQAGVFYGQAAVTSGLADEVGTIARAKAVARELAAQTAEVQTMKNVRQALGLAADASENDVTARAEGLNELETALSEATGEKNATKALLAVKGWQEKAARVEKLEAAIAQGESAARAAYIDDVMVASALPASMRPVLERDAARDFAAFQKDFPRPSREEMAVRANDESRLARLPHAPKGTTVVRDTTSNTFEPTDEELKSVRLTREEWRASNAPKGAA